MRELNNFPSRVIYMGGKENKEFTKSLRRHFAANKGKQTVLCIYLRCVALTSLIYGRLLFISV